MVLEVPLMTVVKTWIKNGARSSSLAVVKTWIKNGA